MRLFAIGDLHLPGGDNKPMDVFGPHWAHHFERIAQDWQERVASEDVVLLPGDLTWAMRLQDAVPDLQAVDALPGRKLLIKGNHDYWWSSLTQLRSVLPPGIQVLQHNAIDLGEWVVCGTRGWDFPTAETPLLPEQEPIYRRELIRLDMALKEAVKLADGRPIVVMLHYPPLYRNERDTGFTQVLRQYPVHTVVYGHLHGPGIPAGFNGEEQGIRYMLTSCDSLDFRLAQVFPEK